MKKALTVVTGLAGVLACSVPMAAEPPGAAADRPAGDLGRGEQMLKKRQQDMLDMHDLMHRIRDAKDTKEKSRLMEQHLQMLRDSWQEMKTQRRQKSRPPLRPRGNAPGEFGSDDADAGGDTP